MFITFEGIDGCGKSTQLQIVKNYLLSHGKDVIALREPGGTLFSEKIRELLLHSDHNLSPESELFLFEAARADLVTRVIKQSLDAGTIVLSDRFFDSTTAYQGYGRGLPVDIIKQLNILATSGLKPDLTFYLHVSLETSRLRSLKKAKDKIENSGDGFFDRVVRGFRELTIEEPNRIIEVNAEGDIKETNILILNILEEKLNLY